MNTLILNSGSSSLKVQLIKTGKTPVVLAKALVDGIGLQKCKFTFKSANKDLGLKQPVKDHHTAVELVLNTLLKSGVIAKKNEIDAVGHRVVHGGEKYIEPVKIDAKIIKELEELSELAPLHNPANLEGIKACKTLLPKTPQVAVFDTAFHSQMPEKAYKYAIPEELYSEHGIRKYGFHGTSHQYVIEEGLKMLKRKNAKIISCHIGNGSSVTAFDKISIDTSMGFTPAEGLPMGTRCGSIDPGIIFHMEQNMKKKSPEVEKILLEKSGLLALSGISSDMRDIYAASLKKDEKALLTIEILAYQIAKTIAGMSAALNGPEVIIFTGGIGEKAHYVRQQACDYLAFMGVSLNAKKNEACELAIHDGRSKVKVFVIPTNEELAIAQQAEKTLK